jgi:hypothetical protein
MYDYIGEVSSSESDSENDAGEERVLSAGGGGESASVRGVVGRVDVGAGRSGRSSMGTSSASSLSDVSGKPTRIRVPGGLHSGKSIRVLVGTQRGCVSLGVAS